MNHLLGWKRGTYSYVSTAWVTELSGLTRAVYGFGLFHRHIPLVLARFVAGTHFCISNNANHSCPWEFHLRTPAWEPFPMARRPGPPRFPLDSFPNPTGV